MIRFFEWIRQSDGLAPRVERLHVAEGVGPAHRRRLAGGEVGRDVIGFDGVEISLRRAGRFDDDFLFGFTVAVNDDLARAAVARRRPRGRHENLAFFPVNADDARLRHAHARGELRDDPAGKRRDRRRVIVYPCLTELADGHQFLRVGERLAHSRTSQQAGHRHGITADVEDAATAEFGVEQARSGVGTGAKTEGCLDHPQFPDSPFADQFHQLLRLRMAAVHERLHQKHVVPPRRLDDGHRFAVVDGDRFLAEDVLARLRATDRPLGVSWVRVGNINGLDRRISQQRLVGSMAGGGRQAELLAEADGAFL